MKNLAPTSSDRAEFLDSQLLELGMKQENIADLTNEMKQNALQIIAENGGQLPNQ